MTAERTAGFRGQAGLPCARRVVVPAAWQPNAYCSALQAAQAIATWR